jgi:hypothetical protein
MVDSETESAIEPNYSPVNFQTSCIPNYKEEMLFNI